MKAISPSLSISLSLSLARSLSLSLFLSISLAPSLSLALSRLSIYLSLSLSLSISLSLSLYLSLSLFCYMYIYIYIYQYVRIYWDHFSHGPKTWNAENIFFKKNVFSVLMSDCTDSFWQRRWFDQSPESVHWPCFRVENNIKTSCEFLRRGRTKNDNVTMIMPIST